MNFKFVLAIIFVSSRMVVTSDDVETGVQVVDEVEDVSKHTKPQHKKSAETVDEKNKESVSESPISEKKRAIDEHVAEESNHVEEKVKAELDKAVESLKETAAEKQEETNSLISGVAQNLEPCGSVECNNRGTCLGSKKSFICACQLGYSGKNCEETVCDSARDCNGRGLCLGTTNQLTCLCNLGFSGRRCETPI